jgi:hypothetical protein
VTRCAYDLSLGQWARERENVPLIDFSKKVTKIEGVFSGTLSYIFNEFSTGSADGPAFSTVVRTARDNGYTVCLSPFHIVPIVVPIDDGTSLSPLPPLTSSSHSLHISPFFWGGWFL